MTNKYYFVVWTKKERRETKKSDNYVHNSILKNIHPVTWAANPPDVYDKYFLTTLLFWEGIPKEVALQADESQWISIEEYQNPIRLGN